MATLAAALANYADSLRFEDLSDKVICEVKRRVIDSLGCMLGAYQSKPASLARKLAATLQATPGATLLGLPSLRVAPDWAAFANGVLIRYLDYNDTYLSKEPAHPSDNIACCLAAAELSGATGKDLITSIVLAYEIQCRLCDGASLRARGWDHPTYGGFSTTLAAAKLLGLPKEKMIHALGIVGTINNQLRQTRVGELSMWKGAAFAAASRNGLFAAMLAKEGMTGPAPIFEGQMGFFEQVSGPFALPLLSKQAHDFMILKTYIKFWPAEYHSQSAIDACLTLRKELPFLRTPQEIDHVDIETFEACVDIIAGDPSKWAPETRETADHSLPYIVSCALLEGDITLESFSEKKLSDPAIRNLIQKVHVHQNTQCNQGYPEGIPNWVSVTTTRGEKLERRVSYPRGHWKNPMTDEEVAKKFQTLAEGLLSENKIKDILGQLWDLDRITSPGSIFQTVGQL